MSSPQRGFPYSIVLASVVLLGLALRLYRLDSESIWYDEVFALSVSRFPFARMNEALIKDLVHPPLHYYAMHWWFQAFGFGPFQGRLLSACFGTLAVLMIYFFARYLFDHRTALLSALLLASSQLAIMYSQEARPYAQFLLIFLGCAYAFLRALREQRLPIWIGFVSLACLLVYTHYYGFIVLGAFVLFGLVYRKRYPLPRAWLLGGMFWVALVYAPWLSSIAGEALHGEKVQKINAGVHFNPPTVHWYSFITALNTFNNGRPDGLLDAAPWWTFIVGGVLFSLPAAFALWRLVGRQSKNTYEESEREDLVYLVLLSVVPTALALTAGFLHRPFDIRYVAFCAAPYYMLVARGISVESSAALRWAVVVSILAYSAWSLRANYFIPYKEDYKHALASVARDYRPGDCAVVAQSWEERQARWAWAIYEGSQPGPRVVPIDAVLSTQGDCDRVWLISVLYRGNPPAVREGKSARRRLAQIYGEPERRRFFCVDIDLFEAARGKIHAQPDAAR